MRSVTPEQFLHSFVGKPDINELFRTKMYECMSEQPKITLGEMEQDCKLQYASDTYWNCTVREDQPLFDGRNRDAERNMKSGRYPVKRYAVQEMIVETGQTLVRLDAASGQYTPLRRRFNMTQYMTDA
jgi:hypothetical protein